VPPGGMDLILDVGVIDGKGSLVLDLDPRYSHWNPARAWTRSRTSEGM